jgi:hypothetical protein
LGGYEDWITAGQTKVSLGNYAQITNGTGGRVLHYFLTDRLGSVDAVTDGNGNLIETRGYDAFGAPRTAPGAMPRRYTAPRLLRRALHHTSI